MEALNFKTNNHTIMKRLNNSRKQTVNDNYQLVSSSESAMLTK